MFKFHKPINTILKAKKLGEEAKQKQKPAPAAQPVQAQPVQPFQPEEIAINGQIPEKQLLDLAPPPSKAGQLQTLPANKKELAFGGKPFGDIQIGRDPVSIAQNLAFGGRPSGGIGGAFARPAASNPQPAAKPQERFAKLRGLLKGIKF